MPATDAPTPAPAPSPAGNVKDTIESILIAFVLAFIFRTFVVEAFVIPTGSMAPTLLGAHLRHACDDCGYQWSVSYEPADENRIPSSSVIQRIVTDDQGNAQLSTIDRVFALYCPNCAFKVAPSAATNPPVHHGDRILVQKYAYLLNTPDRWDVVVFKSPAEPERYGYNQSFIKRLVGNPQESVLILDGDVYIAPTGSTSPADFRVQPKPRHAQEALWRIIYDNDHLPRGLTREGKPFRQPWTVIDGTGWDLRGRTFAFDNPTGVAAIRFDPNLKYDYYDGAFPGPPGQSTLSAYADWLGYNATYPGQGHTARPDTYDVPMRGAENDVNDLKLTFVYERLEGAGPLRVKLARRDTAFIAELRPDQAQLLKRLPGGQTLVVGQPVPLEGSGPLQVEFTNVDYQVTLRIDGRDVLRTTPADYAPDVPALLAELDPAPPPEVAIQAEQQRSRLSHISLWRDVYYLTNRNAGTPARAGREDFPDNVVHLGPDEYFVLGDNTLVSQDGRYWNDFLNLPHENLAANPGVVPGRFLLGKAFFVYWPAGFRPFQSAPGLVPNFAHMRFVH